MSEPGAVESARHPLARRLRALHQPQGRAEAGWFLIEGPKLVGEALGAGLELVAVLVGARCREQESALVHALVRASVPVHAASERALAAVAEARTHQGIVAAARLAPAPLGELADPARRPHVVVAAGLQEPGNLGAVLRVAEAFGASLVVAAGGADPWSPKAVRAAAGSLFRLPVARAASPLEAARALAGSGYRLVASVSRGGLPPSPDRLAAPAALLVGSEGAGLEAEVLALADLSLTVPLRPEVESLNVATATAVLLYAAAW